MSPDRRRFTPVLTKRPRFNRTGAFKAYKPEPDPHDALPAQFISLLERTSELMLVVDPAGEIIRASKIARTCLGVSIDAPTRLADILHRGEIRKASLLLKEALLHGSNEGLSHLRLNAVDGSKLLSLASATLLDGPKPRILIIARPDESNAAQAVASAAHDIKSLLFPSLHLAGSVSEAGCDLGSLSGLANETLSSINRAIRLMDDLMKYSSPLLLEHEKVDLSGILRTARRIAVSRVSISNSAPRFSFRFSLPEGINVSGNPTALERVFVNLLSNALDAMPDGGMIEASVARQDDMTALVTIRDSGVGIPKEVQMRMFEPYFTTKDGRGNGLGLAIVEKFVREHGGRIEVESDVGEGTTFRVLLPLAPKDAM